MTKRQSIGSAEQRKRSAQRIFDFLLNECGDPASRDRMLAAQTPIIDKLARISAKKLDAVITNMEDRPQRNGSYISAMQVLEEAEKLRNLAPNDRALFKAADKLAEDTKTTSAASSASVPLVPDTMSQSLGKFRATLLKSLEGTNGDLTLAQISKPRTTERLIKLPEVKPVIEMPGRGLAKNRDFARTALRRMGSEKYLRSVVSEDAGTRIESKTTLKQLISAFKPTT